MVVPIGFEVLRIWTFLMLLVTFYAFNGIIVIFTQSSIKMKILQYLSFFVSRMTYTG